jgi:Nucleotide-diphospho-sugar transferase
MRETCGFCYVANTEGYIQEALRSAASLRRASPGHPVAMIAPRTLFRDHPDILSWIELPANIPAGPIVKAAARFAPYDRVIFIDTDTFITDDLSDLFLILDAFDIAAAHEPTRGWDYPTPAPGAFCELNTGVLVFRNSDKIAQLFSDWTANYAAIGLKNDQPAFRLTLWQRPDIRIATLPSEYNMVCGKASALAWKALIIHGRYDLERIALEINSELGPRAFVPNRGVFFGYRGRRQWLIEHFTAFRKFFRVLLRPSTDMPRDTPVKWWHLD